MDVNTDGLFTFYPPTDTISHSFKLYNEPEVPVRTFCMQNNQRVECFVGFTVCIQSLASLKNSLKDVDFLYVFKVLLVLRQAP